MTDLVESECSISIPGVKRNEPVPKFTMEWRKKRSRNVRQMQHSVCTTNCQISLCLQSGGRPLTRKASRMETFGTKKESRFPEKAGEFVVPTTYISESL